MEESLDLKVQSLLTQITNLQERIEMLEKGIPTEQSILSFLGDYGIKVTTSPPEGYTELMADNHKCIIWNNQEYFIPENSILYNARDEQIANFLSENHHV